MYAKLFASLYQGTLRGKSHEILVFTNLIAHCDKEGFVDKHFRAIAEETGLTVDEVKAAISELEKPDDESRSLDLDGRRIIRIDDHRNWGWQVVNFLKYRSIRDEETRRETWRKSQSKRRQHMSTPVNTSQPPSTHTDTDTEADTQERVREKKKTPTPTPIEFPPDFTETHTTETACGLNALAAKVMTIKPEWKIPLTYAEMRSLTECSATLEALNDEDWQTIRNFMSARLPQGSGEWQPRTRAKFLENASDVYGHACQWRTKNGNAPKRKGWAS